MNPFDAFRYDGRHALVVGGATGMGAAVTDLLLGAGATVSVMDRAEVDRTDVAFTKVDMSERASIDAAVDGLSGDVDALFSCAGVADAVCVAAADRAGLYPFFDHHCRAPIWVCRHHRLRLMDHLLLVPNTLEQMPAPAFVCIAAMLLLLWFAETKLKSKKI